MHRSLHALCALLALAASLPAQSIDWGYALARETASGERGLCVFDRTTGRTLLVGTGPGAAVAALAEAADGRLWALDTTTGELVEVDRRDGSVRATIPLDLPPLPAPTAGLAIDGEGTPWIAWGDPAVVHEVEIDERRARARAALPGPAVGIAALGETVVAWTAGTPPTLARARPGGTAPTALNGPSVPSGVTGGLDFDGEARLLALAEDGRLFRIDPLLGTTLGEIDLALGEAKGIALPRRRPLRAFLVDGDGRGALLEVDLRDGRTRSLLTLDPGRRIVALAEDSAGRLVGLDSDVDQVVRIDLARKVLEALPSPLGVDVEPGGLAYDALGTLWLLDRGGLLYTVDDREGDATLVGSVGTGADNLCFDGERLLASDGAQLYEITPSPPSARPIGASGLVGLGGAGTQLAGGGERGLFGVTAAGELFAVGGGSGAGLVLGLLAATAPRGLLLGADGFGPGGLLLDRVTLAVRRDPAGTADSLRIQGRGSSAGLPEDRSALTLQLLANGVPLGAPVPLDARGRFRSPRGASPAFDFVLDGDGRFDLRVEDADLAALLPFADGEGRAPLSLALELEIGGAAPEPTRSGAVVILDARSTAGAEVRGQLSRYGAAASGFLVAESETAREFNRAGHRMVVELRLELPGGRRLALVDDPATTRDLTVAIGSATPIQISFDELKGKGSTWRYQDTRRGLVGGLRKLVLDERKGVLTLRTYPLVESGLPLAETGGALTVTLPVVVRLPTASGPVLLRGELDLRRKSETSKDWRGAAR